MEDPIVMYLVVRTSLDMSIGKTAAQCGHAAQMLTVQYFEMKEKSKILQRQMAPLLQPTPGNKEVEQLRAQYVELSRPLSIFGEWLNSSITKIVLQANEKEWARLKEEVKNDPHVIVVDAGLTELEPGTETVVGLFPMRKSNRSKFLQRLQVLK